MKIGARVLDSSTCSWIDSSHNSSEFLRSCLVLKIEARQARVFSSNGLISPLAIWSGKGFGPKLP